MKTICLDFDGVMNTYTSWQGEDELFTPRDGIREFLEDINAIFEKVIIHSTRNPQKIKKWLHEHDLAILIDDVVQNKPPAIVYVDDRAVTFCGNYQQTLDQIRNFKAYWEQ